MVKINLFFAPFPPTLLFPSVLIKKVRGEGKGERTREDAAWKRELLNDTSASGGSRFLIRSSSFYRPSPTFRLSSLCLAASGIKRERRHGERIGRRRERRIEIRKKNPETNDR